jgi:putative component of membrane protein insertase Oxa1/YidC/SpoIIIJ protein YidD
MLKKQLIMHLEIRKTYIKMINKLAIKTISSYQQYISPHKGFCCAYGVLNGAPSCSAYAKQQIKMHGIIKASGLIRSQFKKCKMAAETIAKDRKNNKQKSDKSDCLNCIPCTDCGLSDACLPW